MPPAGPVPQLAPPPRYNVLGIGVSALTFAHARDLVLGTRGTLRRGYICLGTAHGLTEAQRDPELRRIYNESWLTTPDGMPLVWLGRSAVRGWTATAGRGHPSAEEPNAPGGRVPPSDDGIAASVGGAASVDGVATSAKGGARPTEGVAASAGIPPTVERVYGPDLMLAVCDAGRAIGLRHYLFGGVAGVAERLRERLVARFPGVEIVGTFTPPFRDLTAEEFRTLQAEITAQRPDVIWVGLGTPKQEKFMARHWSELEAGVLIGVGAAFDFHSGRVRQAPRWMQRSGLEWFFRLCTEPRRLGPRYLKTNPLFALRVLGQRLGLKRYPLT